MATSTVVSHTVPPLRKALDSKPSSSHCIPRSAPSHHCSSFYYTAHLTCSHISQCKGDPHCECFFDAVLIHCVVSTSSFPSFCAPNRTFHLHCLPHICPNDAVRTWKNEHYEFHGQCDLVNGIRSSTLPTVSDSTSIFAPSSSDSGATSRTPPSASETTSSKSQDPLMAAVSIYWINYEYQGDVNEHGWSWWLPSHHQGTTATTSRVYTIDLSKRYPRPKHPDPDLQGVCRL